jgi:hypothetical protein
VEKALCSSQAYWFRTWNCDACDFCEDQCIHCRSLVLMVHALPRPNEVGVPKPKTFIGNGWDRPAKGVAYSIPTPHVDRPLGNTSLRKQRHREEVRPTAHWPLCVGKAYCEPGNR